MPQYRNIPPIQQFDSTSCWAASFAWWTSAMPTQANITQDQMLTRFSNLWNTDESSPDYGTVSFQSLQILIGQSRWHMRRITRGGGAVSLADFGQYTTHGPCILGYNQPSVGNHVVVAFEAHSNPNRISVMDPNGARFRDLTLAVLSQSGRVLIGYPMPPAPTES